MTTTVRDNPEERRYEVHVDDRLAGFSAYQLGEGTIAFTHTEVGDAFAGRGLARRLVDDELADARRRGLGVLPFCPYVRNVIASNPEEYLDLVPLKARARFGLPSPDVDDVQTPAPGSP